MIRWIFKWLFVRTYYHVSFQYIDKQGREHTASTIVNLSPWLHNGNYQELVDWLADQVRCSSTLVITSVTKLGP